MNLTITPNFTQLKNSQQNPSSRVNMAGGGGASKVNCFQALGVMFNNESTPSNLAPLARDTVSFGEKIKAAKKAAEVVLDTASLRADKVGGDYVNGAEKERVHQLFNRRVMAQGYFENAMYKYFGKYIADDNNPERIIYEFKANQKSADSMWEKLNAILSKKKKEVEEAGGIYVAPSLEEIAKLIKDPVRGTHVLRVSSKKAVKTILNVLTQMAKDGVFKFTEIENYYPVINNVPDWVLTGYRKDLGLKIDEKMLKAMTKPDFFSYPDLKDLRDFSEFCRTKNPELKVKLGEDRANGYQALHVNMELPDGTPAELQIYGYDVGELKPKDDSIYKASCKKTVNNPVVNERLELFRDDSEKAFRAFHSFYMRFTYIGQRLKEPVRYSSHKRMKEKFLTAPKEIRARGVGINQLVEAEKEGEILMAEQAAKVAGQKAKGKGKKTKVRHQ